MSRTNVENVQGVVTSTSSTQNVTMALVGQNQECNEAPLDDDDPTDDDSASCMLDAYKCAIDRESPLSIFVEELAN